MGGWGEYLLAVAAFLLSHALPVRPPVKPWLVARIGARGFGILYSALSLAILAWLIGAAGRAPFVPLWYPPLWGPWAVLAAMVLACLLVALALGRPNPLSFGGWGDAGFDPARPGIVGLVRHPVLAALALWAGAHLIPNGDLAHVLLFGSLGAFALAGMPMVDRRKRRNLGAREWAALVAEARAHRARGPWPLWRIALGLGAVALLVWLHPWLAGPEIAGYFG